MRSLTVFAAIRDMARKRPVCPQISWTGRARQICDRRVDTAVERNLQSTAMSAQKFDRSIWTCLRATIPFFLLIAIAQSSDNTTHSWALYYPLAMGNSWKYSVISQRESAKTEFVTWKVINETRNASGAVFAVWPSPLEADDEGLQLQITQEGLLELGNNFYVLRSPVKKGQEWNANSNNRTFSVIDEGGECMIGKFSFHRCAVIQDDDLEANLRTVTTYVYDVGPVSYEYYKRNGRDFEKQPTRIVRILSYSVKPN